MNFNKWLDTLVEEKGYDTEQFFEVTGPETGWNLIPLGCVVEAIKSTSPAEQAQIKNMIVRIDFRNGDVLDYFKHLAAALAK